MEEAENRQAGSKQHQTSNHQQQASAAGIKRWRQAAGKHA
jgi:hypothetical protein